MRDTLRRNQQMTHELFPDYRQLPCVLAEISQGHSDDPNQFPAIPMILCRGLRITCISSVYIFRHLCCLWLRKVSPSYYN